MGGIRASRVWVAETLEKLAALADATAAELIDAQEALLASDIDFGAAFAAADDAPAPEEASLPWYADGIALAAI